MKVNKNDDRASEKQKIIDNAVGTIVITVNANGEISTMTDIMDLGELIEILGIVYDEQVRRADIMCEMSENGMLMQ